MKDPSARPDHAPIISEFATDPDMVELVSQFVGELPTRAEALLSEWRAQNFAEVQRAAHQLKGASAGYGFPSIGLAASRVEADLRGRSADQISSDAARIADDIRRLTELCKRASAARP